MIDSVSGRLPPIALRPTAASPVEPPARAKPTEAGLSPLATAAKAMASEPPVDTAKVDRIRDALALGVYKVDPDAIAERMIATDIPHG